MPTSSVEQGKKIWMLKLVVVLGPVDCCCRTPPRWLPSIWLCAKFALLAFYPCARFAHVLSSQHLPTSALGLGGDCSSRWVAIHSFDQFLFPLNP